MILTTPLVRTDIKAIAALTRQTILGCNQVEVSMPLFVVHHVNTDSTEIFHISSPNIRMLSLALLHTKPTTVQFHLLFLQARVAPA